MNQKLLDFTSKSFNNMILGIKASEDALAAFRAHRTQRRSLPGIRHATT